MKNKTKFVALLMAVVTILTAVDTLLGAVIKIASDGYNPED